MKWQQVRDLTTGYDSSTADKKTTLPASTSSQVPPPVPPVRLTRVQHLTFTFENGCIANLRGSGTEPKLKYYVELHGNDPAKVRTACALVRVTLLLQVTETLLDMVKLIVITLLEPEINGLKWAGVE